MEAGEGGQQTSWVSVNMTRWLDKYEKEFVRKTLTIPNYLNEEAKEAHINFSALLSDAIRNKLGIN